MPKTTPQAVAQSNVEVKQPRRQRAAKGKATDATQVVEVVEPKAKQPAKQPAKQRTVKTAEPTVDLSLVAPPDLTDLTDYQRQASWDWLAIYKRRVLRSAVTFASVEGEIEFLEECLCYQVPPGTGVGLTLRWMELNQDEAPFYYQEAHKLALACKLADIRTILMDELEDEPYSIAAVAYAHYDYLRSLEKPVDYIPLEIRGEQLYRII